MRILVVEDEIKLADFLQGVLRQEGYDVSRCHTYEETKESLKSKTAVPDLVVLDRLLHQQDAIQLLRPLRAAFPEVKVLVLSAIDTVTEKAQALDKGADDYLAKPFSSIELLARIRALVRRPKTEQQSHLKLGELALDALTRSAVMRGKKVPLSNKEFLVLFLLMKHPGKVFGKNDLIEKVWENEPVSDSNVVEATITNLRRKLEEGRAGVSVRNTRNVGYWIEA